MSVSEQKRFMYFIHELSSENQFGQDLLDVSFFISLMIFLNEVFAKEDGSQLQTSKKYSRLYEQFNDILSYINQHLSEDLNITDLSAHFHLSSSYLRRIFKTETGTTINKYIVAQRISLAKSLLTEGYSVADACDKCGFRDYSNFLKTFTKLVGISPKKYAQFSVK
jgi:AraC-like DNA-binding protein